MSDYLPFAEAIATLEQGTPPPPDAGFLGVRLDPREAALVLLPAPWEATTSYGGGTSLGPEAIRRASHQMDVEDAHFGAPYRAGIALLPEPPGLAALNAAARPRALQVIDAVERGATAPEALAVVNAASEQMNEAIYQAARAALAAGQWVGLLGGDHSSPFGLLRALAECHPQGFGVLHIDAHHDLRAAYEGFAWSHASIFHNVMTQLPQVSRLVQAAIRDYSKEERRFSEQLGERGRCFYDAELFRRRAEGEPFRQTAQAIVEALPERVYVSFDIDGLDPANCPATGTPVPGGLSFHEAAYLLAALAESGRRVIGFDLCEVAPDAEGGEWDANVGARLLYKLCGCLLRSQGRC